MSLNVKLKINDVEFWASARQATAIETLMQTQKGGFARVNGYVATSDRVTPETANHTVLSRLNVSRLYERKINALNALTLNQVIARMLENPDTSNKLKDLSVTKLEETFEARRKSLKDSMQKTLDGVRDDARRQSHDRNYLTVTDGVKVHFKSEKGDDGLRHPVLKDGLPQVESIMLMCITIKKEILTEGEYKKVNSGVPVLMGNAMEELLPKSTKLKSLSLKEDNFQSIVIDNVTILPKDIAGDFT